MPGDSLYVNTKAKQQNTFDAIIVGSGISGGWAAKELCEKGLKVLLLDRGMGFCFKVKGLEVVVHITKPVIKSAIVIVNAVKQSHF